MGSHGQKLATLLYWKLIKNVNESKITKLCVRVEMIEFKLKTKNQPLITFTC